MASHCVAIHRGRPVQPDIQFRFLLCHERIPPQIGEKSRAVFIRFFGVEKLPGTRNRGLAH